MRRFYCASSPFSAYVRDMATVSSSPTYGAPASVLAGVSAAWLVAAGDTPPASGWTARVRLEGPTTIEVSANALGGDFRVDLSPAVTLALPAGRYVATVFATKTATGEVVALARTELRLVGAATVGADARHVDEIALERAYAIRAALLEDTLAEYTIGEAGASRSVKRITLESIATTIAQLERRIRARRRNGRRPPVRLGFGASFPAVYPSGWPF